MAWSGVPASGVASQRDMASAQNSSNAAWRLGWLLALECVNMCRGRARGKRFAAGVPLLERVVRAVLDCRLRHRHIHRGDGSDRSDEKELDILSSYYIN